MHFEEEVKEYEDSEMKEDEEEGKEDEDSEMKKDKDEEEKQVVGIWKRPLILVDLKWMKERYENVKIELDDDDEDQMQINNNNNNNNNDNFESVYETEKTNESKSKSKSNRKIIKIEKPLKICGNKRKEPMTNPNIDKEEDGEKKKNKKGEEDKEDNEEEEEQEIIQSFIMVENPEATDEEYMKELMIKKEKETETLGEFDCLGEKDISFLFGYLESNNSIFLELFFPTANAMKYLNCVQITSAMIKYEDEFDEQPDWVQDAINENCKLVAISHIPFNEETRKFRKYWTGIPSEWSKDTHEFNISFANVEKNHLTEYMQSSSVIPTVSKFASFSINTIFTC
jgi:hypothetical protein